ncbi:MAG TPA: DUF420 domain-containing protein [Gemmataceae bacterium]|nr:DUF420 domain-containing protein [Gemmataceae bacterium]
MLSGPNVILALKVAVVTVTILLLASLVALARGNQRLHGRINIVFFVLTLAALVSLEVLIRFIDPRLFAYFDPETRRALTIHLCFSLPAAALLPLMLYTGMTHRRRVHLALAMVFSLLWIGTFITGVFYLPHVVP